MTDSSGYWSRRRILGGIAAAAATATAAPAAAQFGGFFGGDGGTGLDLNRIISGASNLFEALTLGESDEIKMGLALYPRLIDISGGTYRNTGAQTALQRFAAPLFATSKRPRLPWEVVILNDNTLNAWALPGGKIAVNRGLLRYTVDSDELAAVLSHEIGHAEKSHVLAEMKNQKFTQGLTDAGRAAISAKTGASGAAGLLANEVLDQLEGPMLQLVSTGYSRSHEDEADRHILTVFGNTGYDPHKAANFFRTLLRIIPESATGTTSLFSTHPVTRERIAAIEGAAQSMPSPAAPAPAEGYAELKRTFPTRA